MPRMAVKSYKIPKTIKKQVLPKEDAEQIKLVVWLEKNGIIHFAIPNGGKRNMLEAVKLKRMGLKSGVPDLCIPYPISPYHGLYIELKRVDGGQVSDTQRYWLAKLTELGYKATIARGFEEAKEIVNQYLNG